MDARTRTSALLAVLIGAGCVSDAQFLASKQDEAIQVATSRAQFEMECKQTTATVLSSEVTQPALQGPYVEGVERAEYTIGIAGCGKRQELVVLCPEGGSGCFAAEPGREGMR